jgi:hypothetical protein
VRANAAENFEGKENKQPGLHLPQLFCGHMPQLKDSSIR